jgi:hypothetical protein
MSPVQIKAAVDWLLAGGKFTRGEVNIEVSDISPASLVLIIHLFIAD